MNSGFKNHSKNLIFLLCVASFLNSCSLFHLKKEPWLQENHLYFCLSNLKNETIASTDEIFNNKIMYITLWGTWCPPCLTEIPILNSLQQKYGDDGLAILAIAFERIEDPQDRQEKLRKFVSKHEIAYMVLDGGFISNFEKALPAIRDVKGFPVEILIDRSKNVVVCRNGYGYSEEWAVDLENRIKNELSKNNIR